MMNSKVLESFLIPKVAEEGLIDKFKNIRDAHNDKKNTVNLYIDGKVDRRKLKEIDSKYHFSSMTENEYNEFFIKKKPECFTISKNVVNKFNLDKSFIEYNKNVKLEVELSNYRSSKIRFINVSTGFNSLHFAIIWNLDFENNKSFGDAFKSELTNKYKDLVSSGIIKFECGKVGILKFLNYNVFIKIING